jgi:hypothetical protein
MEQTPYISADILSIIPCKGGAKHRELKEEEIISLSSIRILSFFVLSSPILGGRSPGNMEFGQKVLSL